MGWLWTALSYWLFFTLGVLLGLFVAAICRASSDRQGG